MTIPNYDAGPDEPAGEVDIFGGRSLISQLDRFDIVVPVIIVTQFETFGKPPQTMHLQNLDSLLQSEFGNLYRGAVYYHAAIHSWKEKLASLIDEVTSGNARATNVDD